MKNIIKWFVLLMHKDMQNFEMNEDTDCSVRKQIMNRTAVGLNALTWDEDIYNFACQRAQAIVSDFSHNGCGNYGENIALNSAGSAYRIHMQWFYSTGHHNNYMLSSYVKGACAIYVYQGVWYAVENFALEESENTGGTLSCNAYGLEAEAALNEYIDSHDW